MGSLGSFSLGPLTLSSWLVAAAACLALGALAASVPLRKHRRVRSRVMGLLTNALIAFLAAWKLVPALLDPRALLADPIPRLAAAPGAAGVVAGSVAAALAVGVPLCRHRRLRRVALLPFALFAVTAGLCASAAELAVTLARPRRVAPPLELALLGGGEVSPAGLRGRVVVVNFWATWCPPCRAELPELASFAAGTATAAGGVAVLAVNLTSTEASEAVVRRFVEERALPFAVALDRSGAAAAAWGVRAVPATFVVTPEGEVSASRTGAVSAAWVERAVRRARGSLPRGAATGTP